MKKNFKPYEPEYSQDWFSNNIPVWKKLLESLKDKPVSGIEIGSFEGRSTNWLMENIFTHENSHLVCIDTFKGSTEHMNKGYDFTSLKQRFMKNTMAHHDRMEIIEGRSQEILRNAAFLEKEYDFVYIDGSHQASDVLEDAVLTFRLLSSGGIMIFDDYMWKWDKNADMMDLMNPFPAISAFLGIMGGQYELLHREYQVAVRKK